MVLLANPPIDLDTQQALKYAGKALYVACKFEEYCQQLTFVLEVRRPKVDALSDEESFNELIKRVKVALSTLNKFISIQAKLNEDFTTLLYLAREARNYIAHEAIRDFELHMKMHDGISQWEKKLAAQLYDISLGIAIVSVLLSRHIAVPKITSQEFNDYPNKIKSWVFGKNLDVTT